VTETEAFELLVKRSGWARIEVEADPTSAAWFVAQRTDDKDKRREAFEAGEIVSKAKKL